MSYRLCPLKHAAARAPHETALIAREGAWSFSKLDGEVERQVERLVQTGACPGDRIAFLRPPSRELIVLFFAIWRLGAVACPLNGRLAPLQVEVALQRLFPRLFLGDEVLSFSSAPSHGSALFLFTSGSTGRPKIAAFSLAQLIANAETALEALYFARGDRWLLSLPLYHVGGIGILLRAILGLGAIVLEKEEPSITHLSYVPTQLYRSCPVYRHLKCLLLGGAPPAAIPECLPIFLTYGLTEMGSLVTVQKDPPQIEGHFFTGEPLLGRELKIADDGELLVRGECLFQGYWEEGKLKSQRSWFATGDLAQWHQQAGLTIVGRKDWMFISGGENIQPEEIEQQLLQMPPILEASVIPVEDAEFGKRPVAFVQSSDPHLTVEALQRFLKTRLPKYKIPIALFCLPELPKKGVKVDREELVKTLKRDLFSKSGNTSVRRRITYHCTTMTVMRRRSNFDVNVLPQVVEKSK